MFNLHDLNQRDPPDRRELAMRVSALNTSGRAKGAEPMNTYEIVTERIINLLEQGVIPWRRPWAATGLPRNLVSKKPYRGINVRREVA
jgi:antirestriction protein ArdC